MHPNLILTIVKPQDAKASFTHSQLYAVLILYSYVVAGTDSTVSSASRHAFGSSQVRSPGPEHYFTSCQLVVKRLALSSG